MIWELGDTKTITAATSGGVPGEPEPPAPRSRPLFELLYGCEQDERHGTRGTMCAQQVSLTMVFHKVEIWLEGVLTAMKWSI
jgi:hypothetical protein